MSSKRMNTLLAAVVCVAFQGALFAAPSGMEGNPETMSVGETKYVVEVGQDDPEAVMVLLRYRGVPTVIGSISFDADNGAPPPLEPQDPVPTPGNGNGNGNGSSPPSPPPPFNGGPGNGGSPSNESDDPLDDFDDQVPNDLPPKEDYDSSPNNGTPGTLPVPEPSAVLLSATGLIIIGLLKSRQQKH